MKLENLYSRLDDKQLAIVGLLVEYRHRRSVLIKKLHNICLACKERGVWSSELEMQVAIYDRHKPSAFSHIKENLVQVLIDVEAATRPTLFGNNASRNLNISSSVYMHLVAVYARFREVDYSSAKELLAAAYRKLERSDFHSIEKAVVLETILRSRLFDRGELSDFVTLQSKYIEEASARIRLNASYARLAILYKECASRGGDLDILFEQSKTEISFATNVLDAIDSVEITILLHKHRILLTGYQGDLRQVESIVEEVQSMVLAGKGVYQDTLAGATMVRMQLLGSKGRFDELIVLGEEYFAAKDKFFDSDIRCALLYSACCIRIGALKGAEDALNDRRFTALISTSASSYNSRRTYYIGIVQLAKGRYNDALLHFGLVSDLFYNDIDYKLSIRMYECYAACKIGNIDLIESKLDSYRKLVRTYDSKGYFYENLELIRIEYKALTSTHQTTSQRFIPPPKRLLECAPLMLPVLSKEQISLQRSGNSA